MVIDKLIGFRGLTTDIVIFTIEEEELKVLLIKRADEPFKNTWALPGGFIFNKEGSQDAASRILKEKSGLKIKNIYPHTHFGSKPTGLRINKSEVGVGVYLEQLYTFDGAKRDPRGTVFTVAYFALIPRQKIKFESAKNPQTPLFFSTNRLPKLAFDHKRIISYAIKRLSAKLEYTNAVYALLPSEFTFNQLQGAYEAILGRKLDKRNFRKKFAQLGLIKPIDKKYTGIRQRPAQLFQFISRKPIELKKFF